MSNNQDTSRYVKAVDRQDLPPGTMKGVEIGGCQLLLVNVKGHIYACEGRCPHAGALLAQGELNKSQVKCPRHGSVFDVTNGRVQQPPARDDLRTFEVREENGEISVCLPGHLVRPN